MKQTTSSRKENLQTSFRRFITASFCLVIIAGTAFASGHYPVNEQAKETFKKEFPGAAIISWGDAGDFVKAVFILNGYRSEAYFDEEGELHATTRNLFFNQLPLAVTRAIDKKYPGAEVIEVTEISSTEGTNYLLKLETATKKYRVRLDASGSITRTERIKK